MKGQAVYFLNSDSDKKDRGVVLAVLGDRLSDIEANNQRETGPMYSVIMADGSVEHSFLDELIFLL